MAHGGHPAVDDQTIGRAPWHEAPNNTPLAAQIVPAPPRGVTFGAR